MKSFIWALVQYDWYPHTKGSFGHGDNHTGRTPCEGKGRGQGDGSVRQETPEIASKPPEKEAGCRFSASAGTSRGDASILTSSFQNGETINVCGLGHHFVVLCCSNPSELIPASCRPGVQAPLPCLAWLHATPSLVGVPQGQFRWQQACQQSQQ